MHIEDKARSRKAQTFVGVLSVTASAGVLSVYSAHSTPVLLSARYLTADYRLHACHTTSAIEMHGDLWSNRTWLVARIAVGSGTDFTLFSVR